VDTPPSSITITAQVTAPGGSTSEHTVTASAAAAGPGHQLSYTFGVPIGASVALQPQAHPLLVYPQVRYSPNQQPMGRTLPEGWVT
jgi:hypothetical protein